MDRMMGDLMVEKIMNGEITDRDPIIAFDFDGTLCEDKFPDIGKPNQRMIDVVKYLQSTECKTILWTCRVGEILNSAIKWCVEQGLNFDTINNNIPENVAKYGFNPRKVFADMYVDDKACVDWEFTLGKFEEIKLCERNREIRDSRKIGDLEGMKAIKNLKEKIKNEYV